MSDMLFLKPAKAGAIVRDPITLKPLAEGGEDKPRDIFWLRRLADEDVIEIARPAKPRAAAKAEE